MLLKHPVFLETWGILFAHLFWVWPLRSTKNGIDRKKVSCEEKAKQLAEIGTVWTAADIYMLFTAG